MSEPRMSNLTQRGLGAAKWNYLGNIGRATLQFGVGVLLARLVGPEGFGLIAVALLMIGFGQLFVDFGISAALIQARDINKSDVDSLGTFQILLGIAMSVVGFIGADLAAALFGIPAAASVIRWMSMMFVLRAVGQTSAAILARKLKYRELQVANLAGYSIGYCAIGVPLAFMGWGVTSLIVAQLVQVSINSALNIIQCGSFHRMTLSNLRLDRVRFGAIVLSTNILNWSISNFDSFVIGLLWGPTNLAYYNRAGTLAGTVPQAIAAGLQGVLFSVSARAQENLSGCRRAVYASLEFMMLVTGPALITIASTSSTVIKAVYGDQWLASAPLLTPLCISWLLTGLLALLGPIITGLGRAELEMRSQLATCIVMVPVVCVASNISLVAVAWSAVAISIVRFVFLLATIHIIIRLDIGELLNRILLYACMSGITAGGGWLATQFLIGTSSAIELLGDMAGAGVSLAICIIIFGRKIMKGELGNIVLKGGIVPRVLLRYIKAAYDDKL